VSYKPDCLDAFHFRVDECGVCLIRNQSTLPRALMPALFQFAFTAYAPLVLSREIIERGMQSYAFGQSGKQLDLKWLQNALERLDPGWEIVEGILYSPSPSKLDEDTVLEMIENAIALPV
jgi:hypothetical protein